MDTKRQTVTILLPAYNEEESIGFMKARLDEVLTQNPDFDWEFLIINDGSTDRTLQQIIRLHHEDSEHYNYIDLSRNYGKEIAMMAGFDYARGDAVIIMDADMQHPISAIPEMLKFWREGFDDVYAQRRSSSEGWIKKATSKIYYRLLQKLTRVPIQKDTGDFRLLDRSCIEALKRMREVERNTKGLYSWIGFRKKGIWYDQQERAAGKTKWNLMALLNLALNGFTSYTVAPLRLSAILGFIVSIWAFIYLIIIIFDTLIRGNAVMGYPTIMVTMLFLGGLILLSLGIIGEYLGKVFIETKNRPGYFIQSYNGSRVYQHDETKN